MATRHGGNTAYLAPEVRKIGADPEILDGGGQGPREKTGP